MTHKEEPSREQQEAEAEAAFEAEKAKVQAEENAKAAEAHKQLLQKQYEERKAAANEFDGLVHTAEGKKLFVEDGAVVGGVNLQAQIKGAHGHKHHKHQHLAQQANDKKVAKSHGSEVEEQKKKNAAFEAKLEAEKKDKLENERLSKANQFDGLVHDADGKVRFVDSGAEVHGVNNHLAQVAHKHAAAHGHHAHKKSHAAHKKEHHQHEMSLAQHGHKTAAKRHLEKHAKKAHAHKLSHHNKVHAADMEEIEN